MKTTQQERDLRERAAWLGYKLRRRGTEYDLDDVDEGGGIRGLDSIERVVYWLDVFEHKIPVQLYTPCGSPAFMINAKSLN